MTRTLAQLPPDIIDHLLLFLTADDIISLGKCIPLKITRQVYDHAFHDKAKFPHYDMKMFAARARAKLFFYGDLTWSSGSPVGDPAHYELVEHGLYRRLHTPIKLKTRGTIVQVGAGGPSIFTLDVNGQLHMARTDWSIMGSSGFEPFVIHKAVGRTDDFDNYPKGGEKGEWIEKQMEQMQKLIDRRTQDVFARWMRPDGTWPDLTPELQKQVTAALNGELKPELNMMNQLTAMSKSDPGLTAKADDGSSYAKFSNDVLSRPFKRTRFVDLYAGSETLALDEDGLLWKWDNNWEEDDDPTKGVPICLVTKNPRNQREEAVSQKILKIKAGPCESSCVVENGGVVMLESAWQGFDRDMLTVPNCYRSGYPCHDGLCCRYYVSQLVSKKDSVRLRDYVILEGVTVFLWTDGKLTCKITDEKNHGDANWYIDEANELGRYVQIEGDSERALLLADDGRVVEMDLEFRMNSDNNVRVVELSKKLNVVSIAVGMFHWMMLADTGDVYVWGEEPRLAGSLGLGTMLHALKQKGVKLKQDAFGTRYLRVDEPIKLDLPGKAYGIYAAAQYSMIMIDEKAK